MNREVKARMQSRMKRIGGQVSGIQRMLDDDRYCVDILNQISAVRSALDALGIELLSSHVEGCVLGHGTKSAHAKSEAMPPDQLLVELRTALSRFLK